MAITINWGTKVINIPRADMTLIQSVPTEIRELSLNGFRLTLKNLEDNELGMPHLNTHNHNTEVLLGGITYARIVEIINGYTVTFEDGQYAVNLIGANSNVGDVVNLNQVSVRSANSAGLISNQAIEFSSFNGGVTIDVDSSFSGTIFPAGTPQQPVNNVSDAILIAVFRGFKKLFIVGDITFDTGDNIDGYVVEGENPEHSEFIINTGASTIETQFREASLSGTLDGGSVVTDCQIGVLSFVDGSFINCQFNSMITLTGNNDFHAIGCHSGVIGLMTPTIDMGGTGSGMAMRNYNGGIKVLNKSGPEPVSIDMASGQVILDTTITSGTIVIRGIATLTDNSIGATINTSGLLFADEIQLSSFQGHVTMDASLSTTGTNFPLGTRHFPVDNLGDALAIANSRGLHEILFIGSMTIGASRDLTGFTIIGQGPTLSTATISTGATTTTATFKECTIQGDANGAIQAIDCSVKNIIEVGDITTEAVFTNCGIDGEITLAATATAGFHLVNCHSDGIGHSGYNIDMNGSTCEVLVIDWAGPLNFINWTGGQGGSVEMKSGHIKCQATCTSGKCVVHGVTMFDDNSTGTFNMDVSGIVNEDTIAAQVWRELEANNIEAGSMGEAVSMIRKILKNRLKVNTITSKLEIYDDDDTTVLLSWDLKDVSGNPAGAGSSFERIPA